MSIASFHHDWRARLMALVTLTTFAATLLPPWIRVAKADPAGVMAVALGSAGMSPSAGGSPTADSLENQQTVDISTGDAKLTYPFKLPAGKGEASPTLGLTYNSSAGVGFAGVGWSLNLPSVVRKGHAGMPKFQDDVLTSAATLNNDLNADDYYIDGHLLIPVQTGPTLPGSIPSTASGGRPWVLFRTEVDDGNRYFFDGITWAQQTKSGHLVQYGTPFDAGGAGVETADRLTVGVMQPIAGTANNPIYRWNVVRDTDTNGNTVYYVWDRETGLFGTAGDGLRTAGTMFLTDIYDTANPTGSPVPYSGQTNDGYAHHVHLTWELPSFPNHTTTLANYGLGHIPAPYAYSPIWVAPPFAQLKTVDVFSAVWNSTARNLVREYQLSYTSNNTETREYLTTVQEVGNCGGSLGETTMTGAQISSCMAAEKRPPTTYQYTGITGTTNGAPAALIGTNAYNASMAPDFIADLNGDAVGDLVVGQNGYTHYDCLVSQCGLDTSAELVNVATAGLYMWLGGSLYSCPCQGDGTITGPDQPNNACGQTSGNISTSFSASTNGSPNPGTPGLTTIVADDSMWAFSVLADWGESGRNSFLELLPNHLLAAGSTTNAHPCDFYLGQLGDPSGGMVSVQPLPLQSGLVTGSQEQDFPTPAFNNLNYLLGNGLSPGPPGPPSNLYGDPIQATRIFDVDGDGLPDATLLPNVDSGQVEPNIVQSQYLSMRDREGGTYPLYWAASNAAGWCASPEMDPLDTSSITTNESNGLRALADINGDGLADEVLVNKYDASWSGGPATDPTYYVGLQYLINRGDGRFGVPSDLNSNQCWDGANTYPYITGTVADGWGVPVTPGEFKPFAPQSDQLSADNLQKDVIRFGDLNGDGFGDYAILDANGLNVCLRYGAWEDTAQYRCTNEGTSIYPSNDQSNDSIGHPTIMIADVDGSGIPQVVYFPPANTPYGQPSGQAVSVYLNNQLGSRDGLLSSVSNGYGAITTFKFATVASLNIGSLPVPRWVVTRTETSNNLSTAGQTVADTKTYSYGTPVYDAVDRLFVGFQSVTVSESSDPSGNSPGTVITTSFIDQACDNHNGGTANDGTNCATAQYNAYMDVNGLLAAQHMSRGLPWLVQVSQQNGDGAAAPTPMRTTAYQYTVAHYSGLDGRVGVSAASVQTRVYPMGGATTLQSLDPLWSQTTNWGISMPQVPLPSVSTTTTRSFDSYGNDVEDADYGIATVDTPILTSRTFQLPLGDTSGWNYRATSTITGYQKSGSPGIIDTAKPYLSLNYDYDSLGRVIDQWGSLASPVTALPGPGTSARAAGQPPSAVFTNAHLVMESYTYDSSGNLKCMGDAENSCTQSYTYDSLYNALTATATAWPQGYGNPGGLTTKFSFDRGLGLLTSTTDPAGAMTVTKYDDFGRVIEMDKPALNTAGATMKVYSATYADTSPIRTVHYQTGEGLDNGTSTAAPTFLDHYQPRFRSLRGAEGGGVTATPAA